MKHLLLLLLIAASSVQADEAVKLTCPTRGPLTVSFFNYSLITMKWGDHFQVAAGKHKNQTKTGVPFWTTRFGNGDDLAFFPNADQYYLFYAGAEEPELCSEVGSFVYPVITPPRYEKKPDGISQTQTSATDDTVILSRPPV
ncbi:hypothetical protein [Vagococcus sp. WN89Y]|uniref:hypothetical protein n=1 Tax=Vagococcus sp. WN89Y TaxID=3457258 RepID=UPI003FCC6761